MAELYHYTTGAGLIGMLKDYDAKENPNLTMWATHYAYMNDPSEYEFGKEVCLPFIKEIEDEENIPREERIYHIIKGKEFDELLKNNELLTASYPEQVALRCPYITSFSAVKDSLHMWNMYGQNGNGLALCFDNEKIATDSLTPCWYIGSLNIDMSDIKHIIKKRYLIAADTYTFKPSCDKHDKEFNVKKLVRIIVISTYVFANVASYIKNQAYAEEQEWRVIAHGADKVLFRERNGEIVPYVEQAIPFDSLKYIIVGPTRDFERTRNSILLLLGQKNILWSYDKVIKSNVPYRG